MKLNRIWVVAGVLVAAGVFYWAYRPPSTLSNRVIWWLLGSARAVEAREWLAVHLPAVDWWQGCLPSAFWVLAAVCLLDGRGLLAARGVGAVFALAPMCVNALWEVVQWAGVTDGRADMADVAAGCVGWGVAIVLPVAGSPGENRWDGWRDWRWLGLGGVWALMGLADVL